MRQKKVKGGGGGGGLSPNFHIRFDLTDSTPRSRAEQALYFQFTLHTLYVTEKKNLPARFWPTMPKTLAPRSHVDGSRSVFAVSLIAIPSMHHFDPEIFDHTRSIKLGQNKGGGII